MEKSGLVDREKLMDISGRNRSVQMELAKQWNIVDYPSPAGGCKLTEPNFSQRLRDLVNHKEIIASEDINLLWYGRQFRINDNAKIIAARTQEDAANIKKLIDKENIIFFPASYSGAMVVVDGYINDEIIKIAAGIAARYSKGKNEKLVKVKYGNYGSPLKETIEVEPIKDELLNSYSINN